MTKSLKKAQIAEQQAKAALRSLLNGEPLEVDLDSCGPWVQVVEALHEAYSLGGVRAVRMVWNVLSRVDPALIPLVSAN